ncbi:PDGLE domain-containing protein [Actinokineospora soli]|uniref:PDGLE domain-containing protein n=1 Tax=Actinokineospora soli TaxID=1048753 RepID=A0ABW2TUZ8_9PSEU
MKNRAFWLGFLLVALVLAGGVSYLASSSPDGLDHTLLQGCEETGSGLTGRCAAQAATDHDLADGPLADYAVAGAEGTTGIAGVIGALLTLAAATGLFWALRRRSRA